MKIVDQIKRLLMPGLTRIDRLAMALLERELQAFSLTMPEFRLIGVLLGETEGIPQNVLAARLMIEPASLSATVGKLEAKGLLTRVADPLDTRIKRVQLASEVPQLEEVLDILKRLDKLAFAGVSKEELQTFKRVLRQVEQQLETVYGEQLRE